MRRGRVSPPKADPTLFSRCSTLTESHACRSNTKSSSRFDSVEAARQAVSSCRRPPRRVSAAARRSAVRHRRPDAATERARRCGCAATATARSSPSRARSSRARSRAARRSRRSSASADVAEAIVVVAGLPALVPRGEVSRGVPDSARRASRSTRRRSACSSRSKRRRRPSTRRPRGSAAGAPTTGSSRIPRLYAAWCEAQGRPFADMMFEGVRDRA